MRQPAKQSPSRRENPKPGLLFTARWPEGLDEAYGRPAHHRASSNTRRERVVKSAHAWHAVQPCGRARGVHVGVGNAVDRELAMDRDPHDVEGGSSRPAPSGAAMAGVCGPGGRARAPYSRRGLVLAC